MKFPELTKEQTKRIMNWLAETLFYTVMRKGGYPGLCCQEYDRKPTHIFRSFKEYKNWALGEILNYKKFIENHVTKDLILDYDAMENDPNATSMEVDLMCTLFPFMDSDKDCSWDDKCDAINVLRCILCEIIDDYLDSMRVISLLDK
jgi:hypothetical protein